MDNAKETYDDVSYLGSMPSEVQYLILSHLASSCWDLFNCAFVSTTFRQLACDPSFKLVRQYRLIYGQAKEIFSQTFLYCEVAKHCKHIDKKKKKKKKPLRPK